MGTDARIVTDYSKAGLALCLAYLIPTGVLVSMALTASDPKGRYVFLQLPIVMQAALAETIGLGNTLSQLSWVGAYLVVVPLTLLVLYVFGVLLGRIVSPRP